VIRGLLISEVEYNDERRPTTMEQRISSEELRSAARFTEEANLGALADISDVSFSPVRGDLREFPRPEPESQTLEVGIDVLRRDTEEAVAALHTLAAALDNELPVPPTLVGLVQPYIDAYRAAEEQGTSENDQTQT
jgi:hypothetical protein